MAKSCALHPILLGAGVFPLSGYALETVDLNSPDGAAIVVAEASSPRPPAAFMTQPYRSEVLDEALAAHRASGSFLRVPTRAAPSAVFEVTIASEVSTVLEQVRLASPAAPSPARSWAAQVVGALAIAGLVARRRLVGR